MTKIIDFYLYEAPNSDGLYLKDVLAFDWQEWENNHSFIQWIFPTKEPSNFNPDAPLLTDEDIQIFKDNINVRGDIFFNVFDTVDKFLAFMGIKAVFYFGDGFDGEFELTEDFESRKYTWLEFNHNALRITRFFTWLHLLGLGKSEEFPKTWVDFGNSLLNFMKKTAEEQGMPLRETTLQFWTNAVEGKPN